MKIIAIKYLLSSLLVMCWMESVCQKRSKTNDVNYCNYIVKVPDSCKIKSKDVIRTVECKGLTIQWMHLRKEELQHVAEESLRELEGKWKSQQKESIKIVSFKDTLQGHKMIYDSKRGKCLVQAYGIVNEEPVLLILSSDHILTPSSRLPGELSQIARLIE